MNGGQLRVASIISLGLSCALDASTAAAQQPATGPALEEVVVTARRREENLQDVPMSISVLSGDAIEKRNLLSLNDFIRYVPSVTYQEMGPGINNIIIRGIGGEGDRSTAMYLGEPTVSSPSARVRATAPTPDTAAPRGRHGRRAARNALPRTIPILAPEPPRCREAKSAP